MDNSVVLGLFTAGVILFFAGLIWWVANVKFKAAPRIGSWSKKGLNRLAAGLVLAAPVVAGLIYYQDHEMRVTTLHEEIVPGNLGVKVGEPALVREVRFRVEHPGVAHNLFVSPRGEKTTPAAFPAELAVQLLDPGGSLVLDKRHVFEPETRNWRTGRKDWPGLDLSFTPREAKEYRVLVTLITAGIPAVHVMVSDPLKRDGKRLPGY